MSGTVHRNPTARRSGLAAAGAVLLLTGCGGGGYGSDSAATPAGESTTASAAADFCDEAASLDDRVDEAVSDLGSDASVPDAFQELREELRAIEAPAPIADDWETMAGGLEQMADALAHVDIADPATLDALDDAEAELSTAADRVDTYLRDECGIS